MTRDFEVLDLFCGAGGAAMGIHRALAAANIPHKIIGVDIVNQPRYPFCFRLANAMHYPLENFDFIWASPPCQAYSIASHVHITAGKQYPKLIEPMRKRLTDSGIAWVMENVATAPLSNHVLKLCGIMFDLKVFRHRLFECSFAALQMSHIHHGDRRIGLEYFSVAGGSGRWKSWGTVHRNVSKGRIADWRRAMGIDWMRRNELCQAVPPAYSEFIFKQFLAQFHGPRDTGHGPRIS